MEDADDLPQHRKPPKKDLSPMSFEELDDYIAELEEEIQRVRGEIAAKQAHHDGVEGLFKT